MIPYGKHFVDKDDIKAVSSVIKNNRNLTQGKLPEIFAKKISKITGSKYAVAVSSGTAALHLAVMALNIKKKDNVITTPITFCATSNVVIHQGAKVKLVDISNDTLNINIDLIEKKIDHNTKAIIAVDFRGVPCDLKKLRNLCKKYKLKLIIDCSHSLGSKIKINNEWHHAGSNKFADISTFSFHPVKQITTGEGGVITTNDKKIFNQLNNLVKHGIYRNKSTVNSKKLKGKWFYDLENIGLNYRLTDIQAALGLSQLKKLNNFISKRKKLNILYRSLFQKIPEIEIPTENTLHRTNYHIFVILVKNQKIRYELYNYLYSKKYAVMVHYIPLYKLKFYNNYFKSKKEFVISDNYYNRCISIPFYPSLTKKECLTFFKTVKSFFDDKNR